MARGLFGAMKEDWMAERAKQREVIAQADWNTLGRTAVALEKMRLANMDENTLRLIEKRLFTKGPVAEAWRRAMGGAASPYDAFQIDEALMSGQTQYPKSLHWSLLPEDRKSVV